MCTWERTKYSQFLNIAASPPVGYDVATITSFDIPCNLCPVVASLLFAGNCFILQQNSTFFDELLYAFIDILGEHCSGSRLNLRLLISGDNLFLIFLEWIGFEVYVVDLPLLLNPVNM